MKLSALPLAQTYSARRDVLLNQIEAVQDGGWWLSINGTGHSDLRDAIKGHVLAELRFRLAAADADLEAIGVIVGEEPENAAA